MARMQLKSRTTLILGILLITGMAAPLAKANAESRETSRPVVTEPAPRNSGWFEWLMSLLPEGIRFRGPSLGSSNKPELLAAADCFQSGAGVYCNGFRSLEEYVAAVHASRNLHIPFESLKAKIAAGRTLQEAIRELRPGTNSRLEAQHAQQEAAESLRGSSS